ncbi:MAG TPA: DNA-processing protein DprA, partial [Candidatus Limnocylindrales bacterium]|nr:DNA-processing protein DprA [Candidatus Limnocylindrales bacterium]
MTSPERQARIALACLVEPGTAGVAETIAEHGVVEALGRLRGRRQASRVVGRLDPDDVPGMLAEMSRRGVRVVLPGEPEFPSQLLDLPEPPLALWIRGPLDLRAAALRSVSVVGARACTAYGERATAALAGGLAEDGWAVVSGGAFGIDAAAHRAALAVGGPTVAVLACG